MVEKKFNLFKQWWFWSILLVILIAVGLCIFVALHDFSDDDSEDDFEARTSYKKNEKEEKDNYQKNDDTNTKRKNETKTELTESEKMIVAISSLFNEKLAFDAGDYIKGDISAGDYAFVKFEGSGSYYCEKDAAGEIIDNENFSSFGYVKVHEAGNLRTDGVLININAFDKLGVKGAKEIYEKLNNQQNWNQSGYYKVGIDIEPGKYVVESIGNGYYSILSGPVGNSDIVDNDNFNGKATITLKNGQYLELSRATITKAQ